MTIWINQSTSFRKNIIFILLSYGLALFSYPIIRSVTTTYFLDFYSGSDSPKVWFLSVIVLFIAINIFNKIQQKGGVKPTLLSLAIMSLILFPVGALFVQEYHWISYLMYIWKEVYIVILVHQIAAFSNAFLNLNQIKKFYGYLGAIGSLGGILGGQLTAYWVKQLQWPIQYPMYVGITLIVFSVIIFHFIKVDNSEIYGISKNESPLKSLKGVGGYVTIVALVVALSQFCINIADFKFNLFFDKQVQGTGARVGYLGELYSYINMITLGIQLVLIPLVLSKVKNQYIQFFVPICFAFLHFIGMGMSNGLFLLAGTYAIFKSVDYSIFSYSKEILYAPLKSSQKYGAKYLTDMLGYRAAKALIAFFLIYFQSESLLNFLMILFLILWVVALTYLFRYQSEINE